MASEIVYAILDEESGLFVSGTRLYNLSLQPLSSETKLFALKSNAMAYVEDSGLNDSNTLLQNALAWWLLEQIHNKDRWHINCDLKEYQDAVENFKHLKVVPVNLECRTD